MFKIVLAAAAALTFSAVSASATTQQFDVFALNHVWNDGVGYNGNVGLATGLNLVVGQNFAVDVDGPNDLWSQCSGNPSGCDTDADGFRPGSGSFFQNYPTTTNNTNPVDDDLAAPYGTLVGRVGSGAFFVIGTSGFDGPADATGELVLLNWDHNTNNSGSIRVTATVSPVPVPTSLPLLGGALIGGLVLSRKRRKA